MRYEISPPGTLVLLLAATMAGTPGCAVELNEVAAPDALGSAQAALGLPTTCVTFEATADALLSNPPAGASFGDMEILRVGGGDASLIRFEVSSLPVTGVIESAVLSLHISGRGGNAPVNVHRAIASWHERNVTFASFANHYDRAVIGTLLPAQPNTRKAVDVTALVRGWATQAFENHGLLLETDSNKKNIIVSREGGIAAQKPALDVCYALPVDHCASAPCKNGGLCTNESSGYVCTCTPGFVGDDCEDEVDPCASNPCLNGATCTTEQEEYRCNCALGFEGTRCEIDVDDCMPNPCANEGVCRDEVAGFTCTCAPGFEGAICDVAIDSCAADPCLNGGTCRSTGSGYVCSCPAGFIGLSCEIDIDDCADHACTNGGTCIDGIDAYHCACPPDWGGAHCTINLNSCADRPCLNGAACTNTADGYTCACSPGFTGTHCEIDRDDCADGPCMNGGICRDLVATFECACPPAYFGPTCSESECGSAPDGAVCDDENACTTADACIAGRCVGGSPVACAAVDACHSALACDPETGACAEPEECKPSASPQVAPIVAPLEPAVPRDSDAPTRVRGTVTSRSWTLAGSPYLLEGDVTVPFGAVLRIDPGVIVLAATTDALGSGSSVERVEIAVEGELVVQATDAAPVWFKGVETSAAPSWDGIRVEAGGKLTAEGLVIHGATVGIRLEQQDDFRLLNLRTIDCGTGVIAVQSEGAIARFAAIRGSTGLKAVASALSVQNGAFSMSGAPAVEIDAASSAELSHVTIVDGVDAGIESHGMLQLFNSIVARNAGVAVRCLGEGAASIDHTLLWENGVPAEAPSAVTLGGGVITADPLLRTDGSLQLTSESPAVDAGRPQGAASVDLAGLPRPLLGQESCSCAEFDLGAFELWGDPEAPDDPDDDPDDNACHEAQTGYVHPTPDVGDSPLPSASMTVISGGLTSSTRWSSDGAFLLEGDVTVPVGITLTIDAGTVVRIASSDSAASGGDPSRVELIVNGSLNIVGEGEDPVWFVPHAPNGGAQWSGIRVGSSGQVSVASVVIEGASTALDLNGTPNDIFDLTVRNCGTAVRTSGPITIDRFTASSCSYGIRTTGPSAVIHNALLASMAVAAVTTDASTVAEISFVTIDNGTNDGLRVGGSTHVWNSIFTRHQGIAVAAVNNGAVDAHHVLFWQNATDLAGDATLAHAVVGQDPLYSSLGDSRLAAGSPALDIGFVESNGESEPDRDGAMRPRSAGGACAMPDLGAFER